MEVSRLLISEEIIRISFWGASLLKSKDGPIEVLSIPEEDLEHFIVSHSLVFPSLLKDNEIRVELVSFGRGVSKSFDGLIIPFRERVDEIESLVLLNTLAHLVKNVPDVIREVIKVGIEVVPMVDLRVKSVISFSHLRLLLLRETVPRHVVGIPLEDLISLVDKSSSSVLKTLKSINDIFRCLLGKEVKSFFILSLVEKLEGLEIVLSDLLFFRREFIPTVDLASVPLGERN